MTLNSPSLPRLLRSLRTAVTAFFKHDVALRRAEDGVRVVLKERPKEVRKAKPVGREEKAARRDQQELTLIQAELAELLNELPETRHTLRHLVFVEQALTKKGLRALHKLPLDVLQKALEQLEGVVTNWSPVGLASLRSKMAVAIIDREHMDPEAEADAYRTAAVMDNAPVEDAVAAAADARSDDEMLAAAYAALGTLAPGAVETQTELGSPSARAVARDVARPQTRGTALPEAIKLRELHD